MNFFVVAKNIHEFSLIPSFTKLSSSFWIAHKNKTVLMETLFFFVIGQIDQQDTLTDFPGQEFQIIISEPIRDVFQIQVYDTVFDDSFRS